MSSVVVPGTPWRRVRAVIVFVVVFAAGTGIGVLGTFFWHTMCVDEWLSRRSDLYNIASRLLMEAEAEGRYPSDLGRVIDEVGLRDFVDASELAYPAAGKPYEKTAYDKLFLYEASIHQYGFISGFFEFRQGDRYFRLTG
jgi:hypothetical protein